MVALLPAAYITVKRQQSLEAQHELAAKIEVRLQAETIATVDRVTEAAFRARYSEAATLLGSEQAAVRLAAVTVMAGPADEWDPNVNSALMSSAITSACPSSRLSGPNFSRSSRRGRAYRCRGAAGTFVPGSHRPFWISLILSNWSARRDLSAVQPSSILLNNHISCH